MQMSDGMHHPNLLWPWSPPRVLVYKMMLDSCNALKETKAAFVSTWFGVG